MPVAVAGGSPAHFPELVQSPLCRPHHQPPRYLIPPHDPSRVLETELLVECDRAFIEVDDAELLRRAVAEPSECLFHRRCATRLPCHSSDDTPVDLSAEASA